MQRQCHDLINISNQPVPRIKPGASGFCCMYVDLDNLATKLSSRYDCFVARLAISTFSPKIVSVYFKHT